MGTFKQLTLTRSLPPGWQNALVVVQGDKLVRQWMATILQVASYGYQSEKRYLEKLACVGLSAKDHAYA